MGRLAATLAAALVAAAPALASARQPRLDLATGTVDGKLVLGRTLEEVARVFGRPDTYLREPGGRRAFLRWGPADRFALLVLFTPRGGHLAATAVAFQSPAVTETRLGRLLALNPPALQRALRTGYAGVLKLRESYRCAGGSDCSGRFDSLDGKRHVTFGLAAGHTFLNLWEGT